MGPLPPVPMCADAVTRGSVPVSFSRMGPVDFGPGTGMRMVGSRMFGIEFNLLFSGTYRLAMGGSIHVRWLDGATPLTLTAEGAAGTGMFNVEFGLRMLGRVYVLGVGIDLPLRYIIEDMVGRCGRTFDPWEFTFTDATKCELPVSAWRTVYSTTTTIAGDDYPWEIQARYNMQAWARTQEIGFPNRSSGAMDTVFGAISESTPAVNVPVPADGRLNLAVRWKPQLRYRGTIQLRLIVRRRVCVLGVCTNVDVPTPDDFAPIALSNEPLPDPFEPTDTPVLLPLANFNEPELDFGSVRIGTTAMQNLVVLNPGASTLAAGVSSPSDPAFRLGMNSTCVRPGGEGVIPVTFTPPSRGDFRSELLVASNGATNNPYRIRLIGSGADMTVPPVRDAGAGRDGGQTSVDGGRRPGSTGPAEYDGLQQDASCACRAPAAPFGRRPASWWTLAALAPIAIASRRVRATKQHAS